MICALSRFLQFLQDAGYGLLSVARGMGITLRNLYRSLVRREIQTVQYPTEQIVLSPIFRGHLNFIEEKCIVCELCEKACPVPGSRTEWTIEMFYHIGANKKRELDEFFIDYSTCINCYLCVEACPTDALVPGASYELGGDLDRLAVYDRSRMIFGKEQLAQLPLSEEQGDWKTAHAHVKRVRQVAGGEAPSSATRAPVKRERSG